MSEATDEDAAPLAIDLLQGAWDFDGDAVSVTGLTQTAGWNVTATLVDGVLTIDPGQLNALALGESETLVFTYGVTDGTDATTRTLSVTVEGRNDAPTVAAALSASTDEDAAPLVVNLLQGASDADLSDTLSVTGLTQTGGMGVDVTLVGGVLSLDTDQLTGLAVGESAVLTFAYDITDGIASTAQTVTITVEGRNDAPTAGDDVVDGGTGGTALITLAHLLANDSDPDTSDALSITGVSNATDGTIAFDSNGAVLFTPTTGFIGDAGFDYTISDGNGGTDTAHVTVAVDGAASAFTSLVAEDEVRDAGVSGLAQHLDQGYVATLNDGGYVKVWWTEDGNNSDVYARRYDVDGTAVGAAFRVNTTTALNQSVPSVAALADGGFLISWASMNGSWVNGDLNPGKIYQQRYAADGTMVGGETQVSTNTTSPKNHPSTAALADGGWVTTWASFGVDQTGTWGIYRQRYAANGVKVGDEKRTNTTMAGSQLNPQAIALESGGFVIAWNSNDGQDGSGSGVYFQQYDANGAGVGSETPANVTTAGNQGVGSIASLSDGGFVVTWSGDGGQDGNGYGVFGKVYNSNGSARTGEFQLNQLSTDGQLHPAVAGLTDGSFVVLWRSFDDVTGEQVIMGRRYEADGDAIGGEFQVSDDSYPVPGITRSHPSVAARADGGFVAYWQDPTTGDTAYVTKVFAASDEAPVILARDVVTIVGGTAAITTLFDPSHLQGDQWVGGALQQISLYEFSDQTAVSASGHLVLDGAAVSAETTITVTADELDRLVWRAGEGVGTDTVMVRGYDGERWSDWVEVSAATVAAASALTAGTEMADAGVNGVAQVLDHGSVTTLADGGYVKVWWTADDNTSDVYARRYDAAGTAMGDAFKVNTASAFNQDAPTVAALADGGFVISWGSMDGSWTYNNNTGHIFQQRYDGAGVAIGGETRVSSNATSPKNHPSTVGLADGGWITVWQSFGVDQASTWGVYRQRYDADGTKVGGEARVNTTSAGSQGDVKVISLTDGGFVVQWDSVNGQDGSGSGIYVQRYDADGGAVGGETRINVTTAGDQSVGSLAALSDGGYIVTWSDGSGHDGDGTGVYGRVIGADGLARTGEIQINQTTTGDQKHPAVTQLTDGSIMVLWSSIDPSTDVEVIKGRRFDGDGAALADEFQVSDGSHTTPGITRSHPSISARADGGFVAYWQEPTATDTVFITKVFSPDGTMEGTYLGTDGSDVLFGSSGTDTLTGGLGADVFHFETPDVGLDTITDFQSGMDVIEVVSANFGGFAAGPLDASRFALNAAADADTRFIFDTTTKVLSYDADGTGAGAAVGLASLNVSTLSNTNIFVVS
nr:cadherin-like domain-containing protein [Azospirillum oleiclasticum]